MPAEPALRAPTARVTLHYAQSIDGRIATRSGASRWIGGELSTRYAHELRAESDAVLIGSGTALADDPLLTVRHVAGGNPLRVVLDARGRLLHGAKLCTDRAAPTVHVTTASASPGLPAHVERWVLPSGATGEGVDLGALVERLTRRGARRILVEGGCRVLTAFLRAGLADRLVLTIAPIVLGAGIEAVGDLFVDRLDQALRFSPSRVWRLGDDVMVELTRRASPASEAAEVSAG